MNNENQRKLVEKLENALMETINETRQMQDTESFVICCHKVAITDHIIDILKNKEWDSEKYKAETMEYLLSINDNDLLDEMYEQYLEFESSIKEDIDESINQFFFETEYKVENSKLYKVLIDIKPLIESEIENTRTYISTYCKNHCIIIKNAQDLGYIDTTLVDGYNKVFGIELVVIAGENAMKNFSNWFTNNERILNCTFDIEDPDF